MKFWVIIITAILAMAVSSLFHAKAAEGWNNGRPLVCDPAALGAESAELKTCQDWIKKVLQKNSKSTCCGEGDAYIADAFETGEDGGFVAIITKDYPPGQADDGEGGYIPTPAVPAGTRIPIPNFRINEAWKEGGNPSGHGIVFMNPGRTVYCYFSPVML